MSTIKTRVRRTAPAMALVAATLLAAVATPASAAGSYGAETPRAGFHHHFYRGVPGQNRPVADETTAVAADAGAQEEAAEAYCMDRFKSYDPSTGTYLGYDNVEHACP